MSALLEIRKRLPSNCRILAVSKLQSVEKIRALHQQGQIDFGENYVQEAKEKQTALSDLTLRWHFIGHLQKNKAKDVVGRYSLLHSVDSLELATALDRRMALHGSRQDVLLQMNLALEETKGGFSEEQLEHAWDELRSLKNLRICGLMTMPPLFDDPNRARPYFRRLREWRDRLAKESPDVRELSMGTSSDFHVAAEEGSTWVRLGTVLFGERPAR
jgi:hypothetical protein